MHCAKDAHIQPVLDKDALLYMSEFLWIQDILSLQQTCKKYYQILNSENLWTKLIYRDVNNSTFTKEQILFNNKKDLYRSAYSHYIQQVYLFTR